jgi:glutaminyl-peptide cyclotransferase
MNSHPRTRNQLQTTLVFIFIGVLVIAMSGYFLIFFKTDHNKAAFNASKAYNDVVYQVSLGPRTPGSQAHISVRNWIATELRNAGWSAEFQEGNYQSQDIFNVIGTRNNKSPEIIIGAHYDSRSTADKDPSPEKRELPVPGANDGASGVAILLQLAYVLPKDNKNIGLVFFDAEDQGNIKGWEWILGSRFFVSQLTYRPEKVIILDMVGDRNLTVYFEANSDQNLLNSIWDQAKSLGFDMKFIPENKYNILDDHIPFIEKGITAVDIIDFDYPYWHTTQDTPDKISTESLQIVTETLLSWINNQ